MQSGTKLPARLTISGKNFTSMESSRKLRPHPSRASIITHPEKQHRNSSLKRAWGICEGDLFINLRIWSGQAGIFKRFLQGEKCWWASFFFPPLGSWTLTGASTNTFYLHC